ncbi:MAG: porin family protein [Gemmatimonadetes bacterium]|nr:porin family protein [Gemmatimonadota bacterium]
MRNLSRLLIAAPLFLLTPAPTAAQTKLGITGGLNLASVDISSESGLVPDFESVTRLSLGLSATIPISETWGLQLAGGYSQKGAMSSFTEDGANVESTLKMDYIELAALGMVHLPVSGERVSAHLLAGPALALETSCGISAQASFMGSDLEISEDCDDSGPDRSNFDVGLAGGGGIEIGLSDALGVSLDALYTFGFLDMDKADDDSLKHRVLSLRVGLVYSIG